MNEEELRALIRRVMAENPTVVDNVRNGKPGGQGYLVGRTIMKMPADAREPSHVLSLLQEELAKP